MAFPGGNILLAEAAVVQDERCLAGHGVLWASTHGRHVKKRRNGRWALGAAADEVIAGKLSDTTLGAYYSFDKSTTAYLLTSLGRNTPSVTSTYFTADTTGESQTTAVGLRYNY